MENQNARLKNTLVSLKGNKLSLSVDLSSFFNLNIDEKSALTQSGNSYRMGGSESRWVKLDGELDGVMVKLDVIVSKSKYEKKKELKKQREMAAQAHAELQQAGAADVIAKVLGLSNPDELRKLIELKQLLDAQEAAKSMKEAK